MHHGFAGLLADAAGAEKSGGFQYFFIVRALGVGALGLSGVVFVLQSVSNRTSRAAGELRSAPSGPDDWHPREPQPWKRRKAADNPREGGATGEFFCRAVFVPASCEGVGSRLPARCWATVPLAPGDRTASWPSRSLCCLTLRFSSESVRRMGRTSGGDRAGRRNNFAANIGSLCARRRYRQFPAH